MAYEWIKVGMGFRVTCDTRDPRTLETLVDLTTLTGHLVYYKRPDGKTGSLTVDSYTSTAMVATVSATLNPLTVSSVLDKWKNGYHGPWEFYPYGLGAGSVPYRGKEGIVVVHPQWRNAP
jgi:hypothetical protein